MVLFSYIKMSRKCNKSATKARRLGAVYMYIYMSNNLIVEKRNKN